MKLQSDPALKYRLWADQLRQDIASGHFKPGDRLPSLAQIRNEHGMSRSTADRAYSLLEQEGKVERRNGSGVYVTQPQLPETGLIGIIGGDISERPRTPFWTHLLEGLQQAAIEADKRLVLLTRDSRLGWDSVEGVLFASCSADDAGKHWPAGMPRVSLLRSSPNVVSVMADEYESGRLAAEHLLEMGHTRIAFLHYKNDPVSDKRVSGYRSRLHEAGIDVAPGWVRQFSNAPDAIGTAGILREGTRAMSDWLEDGWRSLGCTAVICQNDHAAIGAMKALQDAGIQIPHDISVIGFDGTETGESCAPTLSSIRIPVEEIAEVGFDALQEQRDYAQAKSRPVRTILLSPTLVARESTAPPR